jgi:hypothetical protein
MLLASLVDVQADGFQRPREAFGMLSRIVSRRVMSAARRCDSRSTAPAGRS